MLRRSTHTFLTPFGPGLNDDRYHVERFQSKADGEIRPRRRNGASKKSRGKASREIVSEPVNDFETPTVSIY